jgi:LysM repeat protein
MNEQISKVTKNLKIIPLLLALILAVSLNGIAFAAPPLQGDDQQEGAQPGETEDTNEGEDGDNAQQDDLQPQSQMDQSGQQPGMQPGATQPGATQQGQQGTMQQGNLQASGDCAQVYTVQAGDTLSIIAERLLGDPQSFNLIFDATNNAVAANTDFTPIEDANIIEVGQTLCIPAQAGQQQATTGMQQQGQLQQGGQQQATTGMQQQGQSQQGTMANQNLLSVPEGMSKVIFENLSSRDLIVDVSGGPTPQSIWVGPGTHQQFVIQPGQYIVMGHQPGGEFGVTPNQFQLAAGQLVGLTCQETGQCEIFSTGPEVAMADQGTLQIQTPPNNAPPPPAPFVDENDNNDN